MPAHNAKTSRREPPPPSGVARARRSMFAFILNSEVGHEIEKTCREPIVGGARHSVRAAPATGGCKFSPTSPSQPVADQNLSQFSRRHFGVRVNTWGVPSPLRALASPSASNQGKSRWKKQAGLGSHWSAGLQTRRVSKRRVADRSMYPAIQQSSNPAPRPKPPRVRVSPSRSDLSARIHKPELRSRQ